MGYAKRESTGKKPFKSKNFVGGAGPRRPEKHFDLYDTTCAKCGQRTKVPFRPTGEKPVYCRDCFEKEAPRSRDAPRRESARDVPRRSFAPRDGPDRLEQINKKLDKIMKALKIE